ncbi:FkbM family methyltransferase [Candidatus Poribacteria bacterium]|nr:FkbM family methyltransferase [Candidatus Poribacteria bacterium]
MLRWLGRRTTERSQEVLDTSTISGQLSIIIDKLDTLLSVHPGIISNKLDNLSVIAGKLDTLLTLLTISTLQGSARFQDPGRLLKFGRKVYSQSDEDGIIQEIVHRIGPTSRTFVEIGVGNGLENNTASLLIQGWNGVWVEANPEFAGAIRESFRAFLDTKRLRLTETSVAVENVNDILRDAGLSGEIDILSIDVDGNDYHVLSAIREVNPRIVIIEYNAKFPPPIEWIMKYDPNHSWDGTDYFGASLKSMERLFSDRGYSLVGASVAGTNAFFVRADLVGDKFCPPYTAENHYEPARYWIINGWVSGHRASFGPHESPGAR